MNKILLVGDSITEWNPLCHKDVENIGQAGARTDEILKILLGNKNNYKKIFILAGINDINQNIDTVKIIKNYTELIQVAKTKAQEVYVLSTLPTRVNYTNSFVQDLNKNLFFLSEDLGAKYIDCYDRFLSKIKLLADRYSVDSVHLNDKGYILLNSILVKYIYNKEKMKDVKSRFLEYIKWDTTSSTRNQSSPSTIGQHFFAYFLKEDLINIGVEKIDISEYGYLTATIPKNTTKQVKKIAFIAHMDTAPDASGRNIDAKVWPNYDGSDLKLNNGTILSPKDFPELNNYIGKELITASGDSLLGGDDKAGIAEIVTAMERLVKSPEIEHGTIKIAFTPDEEVGHGCEHFDIDKFGADYAYTVDGGELGELEYENFNAASAVLKIKGRSVHPGNAKNKMIHAGQIAIEFENMLPVEQRAQYTEGYEGFIMLTSIIAGIEDAKLEYIIRDHDRFKFEAKKNLLQSAVDYLKSKYINAEFNLKVEDSYYNMKEKIEPCMFLVDIASEAMEEIGVKPHIIPVRGGTDGARLSYMGLPCPNIFTGGHNFHGRYEYIVKESMEAAVEVILGIAKKITKIGLAE